LIEVQNDHRVIVVGVDGSPAAERAVEWALEEARACGDDVILLHAWQYPLVAMTAFHSEAWPALAQGEVEKVAGDALDAVTETARKRVPEVRIDSRLVQGHPGEVLVDASGDARLLVVGSRGLGGFTGMLLGSVSSSCVHHARCPVVVVRD
jgi:nucleotide-binding universal stress UspA family protein